MGKLAALVTETRDQRFRVVAGSASYLLAATLVGCSGGINGLAAVLDEPLCKMHELAVAGQWEKALVLQRIIVNIDLLLMQECGPASLKAAMELLGYSGGLCRSLLPPIGDDKIRKIKRTLENDKFL